MRTAHLADDQRPARTACGYPWEDWQDSTTRVTLAAIESEPDYRVRLALRDAREGQRREEESEPVRLCPACAKLGSS